MAGRRCKGRLVLPRLYAGRPRHVGIWHGSPKWRRSGGPLVHSISERLAGALNRVPTLLGELRFTLRVLGGVFQLCFEQGCLLHSTCRLPAEARSDLNHTTHHKPQTTNHMIRLVGKERLELSPREGLEPKSSASTNFATRPGRGMIPFESGRRPSNTSCHPDRMPDQQEGLKRRDPPAVVACS
jgi:hypothetical protein